MHPIFSNVVILLGFHKDTFQPPKIRVLPTYGPILKLYKLKYAGNPSVVGLGNIFSTLERESMTTMAKTMIHHPLI